MSAGLLNPWYLLGVLAIAAPVLIHLVAQQNQRGRPFPSLMLIRQVPLKRARRRTLRDRALLALRCAALVLLALAFAGPYLADDEPAASAGNVKQTVFLLDNSFSMRADERFSRAVDAAGRAVDALPSGELAALVLFNDLPRTRVAMTADRTRLEQGLRSARASDGSTAYARALAHAALSFDPQLDGPRTLILYTDLQRSGLADAHAPSVPADIELVVRDPGARETAGLALTTVDVAGASAQDDTRVPLHARLLRRGTLTQPGRVRVSVDGHRVEDRLLRDTELATATASIAAVPATDHVSQVSVDIEPGVHDSSYRLTLAQVAPLRVSLVTSTGADSGAVFIEQALALAGRPSVLLRRVSAAALNDELLSRTDVVIVAATALDDTAVVTRIDKFVAGGGGLLLIAGQHPRADAPLLSTALVTARLGAIVATPTHITTVDRSHPVFVSLPARQLRAAPVWRRRDLVPGDDDSVLARFDDGKAALVERAYGAGRSMVLATALAHDWNALSLEPGFPVLMIGLVQRLAGRQAGAGASAVTVGEVVDLQRHALTLGATELLQHLASGRGVLVESPGGELTKLTGSDPVVVPREAGFYTLRLLGGTGTAVPLAVNVAAGELDPAVLDPDTFLASVERRPVGEAVAKQPAAEATIADTPWWLLIVIVTLVCIMEGYYAARLSRHTRRLPQEGAG